MSPKRDAPVPPSQRDVEADSAYVIEPNVPMPARHRAGSSYPWKHMQSGDSFLVAASGTDRRQAQRRVYVNGRAWCKRHRSAAHIETRVEERGVRVWLRES